MHENFTCQGKLWTREELPGIPVKVSRMESEGRYCPVVSTTWTGKHILSDGERELTVERSTVTDRGKLGASLTYSGVDYRPNVAELDRVLAGMGYRCGA